jgi:hypothetical protein
MSEKQYSKKITKIEIKPNYIVVDFTNPPNVIKYVRKVIQSKSGDRDLLTLAIIKDPNGDPNGDTKTVATSLWKPINSKSGRKLVRYYLRKDPKKVCFSSSSAKYKFLNESSIVLFLTGGGYV